MTGPTGSGADGSRVGDYDYVLPPELIARYPTERRDQSRVLLLDRQHAGVRQGVFTDLTTLLRPGDLLVVNESKVVPARLLGSKPSGARAEVLLLRPVETDGPGPHLLWEALVRPGAKLKPGRSVVVSDELSIDIVDLAPGGARIVRLITSLDPIEALEAYGHVPLPPYLGRPDEAVDRVRYQTVYARTPGSVAAPTAGLHFTRPLLDRLVRSGVRRAAVTLHVGPGTFRPVDGEDPSDHHMHTEFYDISPEAALAVNETRAAGGRVWAVGTTVVRTLESAVEHGQVVAGGGSTRLFIRPPYTFQAVDALITNFHLPRSTLLMLVAAFGGYGPVREAYRIAVEEGFRFYSYGDAMVLV